MANILVGKNYTISDHKLWYNDRSYEPNIEENYSCMEKLMVSSAKEHLQDLDEILIHRGESSDIREVFRKHFVEIYDVWKQGNNVLYVDLDVMFMQPTTIFGKFNKFAMFNYTDPMHVTDDHYQLTFQNYFNCGVRYYPASMHPSVWDHGFKMLNNWNPKLWDCEQIIYNAMLWGQNEVSLNEMLHPELSWQMLSQPTGSTNNIRFNQNIPPEYAKIIHVHGSRGSGNRLSTMKQLADGVIDNEVLYL